MANETVLDSPNWHRALAFRERLDIWRTVQASGAASSHAGGSAHDQRLERWRAQLVSADSRFSSPSELHACTDDEFIHIVSETVASNRDRPFLLPWFNELQDALLDRTPVESEAELSDAPLPGSTFLVGLQRPIERALRRVRQTARRMHREGHSPYDPETVSRLLFDAMAAPLIAMFVPTAVLELNAARLEGRLAGTTKEERFAAFIERLRDPQEGLALLHEYPVLARLVTTWLQDWVTSSVEFLGRLSTDWNTLVSTFGDLAENDALTAVEVAGDRHRRGRAVAILTFESGLRLVYKPRPISVERNFQHLLLWLNERSDLPSFRRLVVLDCRTHGWVEYVEAESCSSLSEVSRFYERQGAYLAILQTLSAVDLHSENIVAMGEHPVLVDLEGLFHHTRLRTDWDLDGCERRALEVASESVLRVGFLPQRLWGDADMPGIDMSALGATPGQRFPIRVPRWEGPDTDEMRRILGTIEIGKTLNRPAFDKRLPSVHEHVEDIVTGFTKAYHALENHRNELLGEHGPIAAFGEDETRVLFRPTTCYAMVLLSSFHPQALRDGLDRDRRLDRLLAYAPDSRMAMELIAAERRDLWHCDIPLFTTRPDSCDVWDSDGKRIENVLEEPGMESARRRLGQLGEADLSRQCSMIRMAIATSDLNSAHALDYPNYLVPSPVSVPEREDLLEAACSVGNRLDELAICGEGEGSATWIGVTSEQGKDWSIAPVGSSLYEGLAGIAFFLATLGALSEDARYTALSRAAMSVMRKQLKRRGVAAIGGFGGTGGHIYVLTHLSVLWEDPTLLDEAKALADTLPEAIERDASLDVISGAAGCIVPLLNLHRIAPSESVLEAAMACGDRLIAAAQRVEEGVAWSSSGLSSTRPLAGFAHGAAGCAWALLELAGATAERRFRDVAIEAIRYERSLFSPEYGNWRDLRDLSVRRLGVETDGDYFMSYWCHGAAGIGLARLRCLDWWDDDAARAEIDVALRTTLATGFGLNHCLCHGDLGNVDFLIQASARLENYDLRQKAGEIGGGVLASRRTHGWITGYPLGLEAPGLMAGLAGIGYGLLRLADPERVPSVLVLDPPSS